MSFANAPPRDRKCPSVWRFSPYTDRWISMHNVCFHVADRYAVRCWPTVSNA